MDLGSAAPHTEGEIRKSLSAVCVMRLSQPLQTGLWKSGSLYSLVGITNVGPLLTDPCVISPLFCLSLILFGSMVWYCGISGIPNPVLVSQKSRKSGVCFMVWVLV